MNKSTLTFDEICESQSFNHDQEFVIYEDHQQELSKLKADLKIATDALELICLDNIFIGENGFKDEHFLNQKQAREALKEINNG